MKREEFKAQIREYLFSYGFTFDPSSSDFCFVFKSGTPYGDYHMSFSDGDREALVLWFYRNTQEERLRTEIKAIEVDTIEKLMFCLESTRSWIKIQHALKNIKG